MTEEEPAAAFPAQPDGVPWPTQEWAEGAWPDGVDRGVVDAATDTAFADGADQRVHAVVIVHRGAIVYERYSPNPADGPNEVMPSYSMAKSVLSAMIGILVRDGRLDVHDPAPVPEWHQDPDNPRAEITVEQMLHMATGMEWDDRDHTQVGSMMYELVRSDDAAAYTAAQQPTSEPGTAFDYNNGTSVLLSRILGDEVGGDADDVRAFLDDELFDKIGMDPVHTDFDEAGTWFGAYSADTTARRLRQAGAAVPPWWGVGRRAGPAGGVGRVHPLAQPGRARVRRSLVAGPRTAGRLLRRGRPRPGHHGRSRPRPGDRAAEHGRRVAPVEPDGDDPRRFAAAGG